MKKILKKALLLTAVMVVGGTGNGVKHGPSGGVFHFVEDRACVNWNNRILSVSDAPVGDPFITFCGYTPENYEQALTNHTKSHK
jgi:hypothetical protein